MLFGLTFCPLLGKLHEQLDLPLEDQSTTILHLSSVRQLITGRQAERNALKNTVKQLIEIVGCKA